ncbi:MAG TPA: VOC family protein [Firmicutes bacterium]|jgi:catechol 2,3-dioxygenase|nr:VOC family protein [Bacillota bacterium]
MGFHDAHATYVGSLQLRTLDLERAVQFYRQVVGLKTLEQDAGSATLSADGKTPLLSLVQPAGVIPKPPGTTGLYHFALLLPERADLALFIRHLVDKVVRFGASNHLVSEAVYFSDPDGNGIEVYADTDPDTWSWRQSGVAMDTLPLDFQDLMKAAHPMKQAWDGLPGSTVIGHIHLQVSELLPAEAFYRKGLGFEVVSRYGPGALFMSTAKYHHHIALNTWLGVGAPRPPKNSAGLDHFTLVFPDQQLLAEAVERLKELGTPIDAAGSHAMVEDPSGNAIVLRNA